MAFISHYTEEPLILILAEALLDGERGGTIEEQADELERNHHSYKTPLRIFLFQAVRSKYRADNLIMNNE